MLKKIWLGLACIGSLFSATTYSETTTHVLRQGVTVEYELPVNQPQIFSNIFFWTVQARCKVTSETQQNPINVTMLKKSGSVNNIPLSAGSTTQIVVQQGDVFNISAVSGAKVELINKGTVLVRASCYTN